MRHELVGLVDRGLDLRAQVRVAGEVGHRRRLGLAVRRLPRREVLLVDGDQRADERPPVADHHRLADHRVRAQGVLQTGRRDVLAACRHDDLLLAAGDPQEPIAVQLAEVAGAEPAVLQ